MDTTELPKRRIISIHTDSICIFKFSDLFERTDEELLSNRYGSLYIDDLEVLVSNFTFFKKLLSFNRYKDFYSKDYEVLKFIEDSIDDYEDITLSLVDDFENKDRSYINASDFKRTKLIIPMVYTMWDSKILDNQSVSGYSDSTNFYPFGIVRFNNISYSFLKWVKEEVLSLYDKYGNCSDLEKIIIISNYLQDRVQYVDEGNVSKTSMGTFLTDSKDIVVDLSVHSPQTVLQKRFGVCEGIANATTLLLNNPLFDLNVRSVFGSGHVWNVVLINGNYYYIDNTWSITRNKDLYFESLKAKSFNSDYLLFGSENAEKIGHHIPATLVPQISSEDYYPEELTKTVKKLSLSMKTTGYKKPVFKSFKKSE